MLFRVRSQAYEVWFRYMRLECCTLPNEYWKFMAEIHVTAYNEAQHTLQILQTDKSNHNVREKSRLRSEPKGAVG